jgi:hypothetical protein
MDRTSTTPYKEGLSPQANPVTNPLGSKVDSAARSAHETTDKIADTASGGIERARDSAHRAVDGAASAAQSTASYASSMIDQAKQSKLLEQTCDSIRARPLVAVVGAVIGGYLLGRLARF